MADFNKGNMSATISRNVAIQTRPTVAKPNKPLTFEAGVKPPRKRATAMNWPPELEGLKAPGYRFTNADGAEVRPIEASTGEVLSFRMDESGNPAFYRRIQQEDGTYKSEPASDVLFQADDGSQWTPEHVKELVDYDYLQMTGTADVLNKLYNAVQRFGKATGKGLIVRHESQTEDERGNILTMTKNIIRIR